MNADTFALGGRVAEIDPVLVLFDELRQLDAVMEADHDRYDDDEVMWNKFFAIEDAIEGTLATTAAGIAVQVEQLAECCRDWEFGPRQEALTRSILAGLKRLDVGMQP